MTQSRFLEAPLVRQADGELKNPQNRILTLAKLLKHYYCPEPEGTNRHKNNKSARFS